MIEWMLDNEIGLIYYVTLLKSIFCMQTILINIRNSNYLFWLNANLLSPQPYICSHSLKHWLKAKSIGDVISDYREFSHKLWQDADVLLP